MSKGHRASAHKCKRTGPVTLEVAIKKSNVMRGKSIRMSSFALLMGCTNNFGKDLWHSTGFVIRCFDEARRNYEICCSSAIESRNHWACTTIDLRVVHKASTNVVLFHKSGRANRTMGCTTSHRMPHDTVFLVQSILSAKLDVFIHAKLRTWSFHSKAHSAGNDEDSETITT